MSYNNDVYKLEIGDLVERITWDAHAKKLGVVVGIGEEVPSPGPGGLMIKVCWADNYGTFWAQPSKLKLIAKAKKNV
jgi:hypothetical protein